MSNIQCIVEQEHLPCYILLQSILIMLHRYCSFEHLLIKNRILVCRSSAIQEIIFTCKLNGKQMLGPWINALDVYLKIRRFDKAFVWGPVFNQVLVFNRENTVINSAAVKNCKLCKTGASE